MLKDIETEGIKDIAVAAILELNPETSMMVWNVYLINYSKNLLEGVIVSSHGWGTINGEEKKTSQLRHFLKEVEPISYKKIGGIGTFIMNDSIKRDFRVLFHLLRRWYSGFRIYFVLSSIASILSSG